MTDKIGSWTFIILVFTLAACGKPGQYQFEMLKKDKTGLDFENMVKQSVDFNVFAYMYFFNGGGVGVGDFNNDGLEDLYFTSNMGSNKLFLNKGGMKFENVTEEAGVAGMEGWSSGVSVADVNADGLLDIYVSQIGDYGVITGQNQLFICTGIHDGVPVFEDRAKEHNLALVGFSTQASFFDYDRDGDLDMFQLNHSLHQNGTFGQRRNFDMKKHEKSGDKLFRNDNGRFTETTVEAGINSTVIGYGLGIATGDLNNDGWPDIYVGNDFHENDYLYLNNRDGTFSEALTEQMMHTSRFSMGVDIGDINNDGQSEVISLDMLPDDPYILKTSLGEDDYGTFRFKLGYGYNHQYARNNLQLNNGNGTFTEIGLFAGVYASDWSWASLFADIDHDGHKDLFISNGIPRRMNDIDYLNFRLSDEDIRWKTNTNYIDEEDFVIIEKMPQIKIKNRIFLNNADLTFKDISNAVKNVSDTYSNGAAVADLDNDGDLDFVVNNIYAEPYIYKNLEMENRPGDASISRDYLKFVFRGIEKNTFGIGSRVLVFKGREMLSFENYPVRGYQSTVSGILTIGVGDRRSVDSVAVVWPDGTFETVDPVYNGIDTVEYRKGLPEFDFDRLKAVPKALVGFEDVTEEVGLVHFAEENSYVDFNRERLIPHMVGSEGPALAIGDINGDGLEDVFIGASKRRPAKLFFQNGRGKFDKQDSEEVRQDSIYEDVDAKLVDMDGDGDLDLVVASGGNEYWGNSEYLNSRLYLNDGAGIFVRAQEAFSDAFFTASCAEVADYDGDGLPDVFFGVRAVPKNYGVAPESALYRNLGNGKFRNVSQNLLAGKIAGMVKDAAWGDMDADGDMDLVVALEWGGISVMVNESGNFEKKDITGLKSWWNFVLPYDFDGDGDVDILAGNTGKNTKLKPTSGQPLRLYIEDFDDNGQIEQILTYYVKGKEVPFANYKELTTQMPNLKKKYLYSKDMASSSLDEVFGKKWASASLLRATTLESMCFENLGDMSFRGHALPDVLQFSSLEAASVADLDGDGTVEVVIGGNFHDNNIEMGRYDGNYGNILKILPNGAFEVYSLGKLIIKNQVRNISATRIGGKLSFVIAKNEDFAQVIRPVGN